MSVRGSKNKIILYIAGICSIVFVILLYHNASQRLEEMEKSYERCHLNEESLSAQLQVNLEYKVRLEKSLQQEKSEHSQVKEEMQNKLEEERQARERENMESINKFTALQQQYKFLQSQHEDVNLECGKLRQMQLNEVEEKSRLETQIQSLRNELKLVKESKDKDISLLKIKYGGLEKENAALKADKIKLMNEINLLEKHKGSGSQIKLPEKLPFESPVHKSEGSENILQVPETGKKMNSSSTVKSSTSANKIEQELFPSGNNVYVNTSTPMINPDAVLSQDKMLSAAPVAQPKQESVQGFPAYDNNKENVGAKPEEGSKGGRGQEEVPAQGVLRAPDIMNDFGHVPAIQEYKERLRQGLDRNNNGGEVGDEGEPIVRIGGGHDKKLWREGDDWKEGLPFVRHAAGNEIPKNPVYNYQAEYDGRKEEGEDDDDVDPLDYHNGNENKNPPPQQQEEKPNFGGMNLNIPLQDKHQSVMIQPK